MTMLSLSFLDGPQLILLSLLALPALILLATTFPTFLTRRRASSPSSASQSVKTALDAKAQDEPKSIMQPENSDLLPPRDDPFTLGQLKEFDGSDPEKPIYVSIKGTIFDVTAKKAMYGPGGSYAIFAGKDGSKGLGMSSLKNEDAIPDYSTLPESEMKVLNDWHAFFSKRYNIVGRVTDLPPTVANL